MAQRTYLVGLYLAGLGLQRYIGRYQNQLNANASPEVLACLVTIFEALGTCLPLIKPVIEE